jgi:hypothetical protein
VGKGMCSMEYFIRLAICELYCYSTTMTASSDADESRSFRPKIRRQTLEHFVERRRNPTVRSAPTDNTKLFCYVSNRCPRRRHKRLADNHRFMR